MMLRFGLFLVCIVLLPTVAYSAESDSVRVMQTITGADTTPPSIPTGLAVTPLSITSLQVSWMASSDNVAVLGYEVWRDSIRIATTTSTTFIDTGLTTSTSYQYYVTAFDAVGNTSGSSTIVTGTTLSPEVVASGQSARPFQAVEIDNITFDVDRTSIRLTFDTSRYVQTRINWSTNGQILGTALNEASLNSHLIGISDLVPNTTYEIDILLFYADGTLAGKQPLWIQTEPLPAAVVVPNVRNVQVEITDSNTVLQWNNPRLESFSRVRVVKSNRFFPVDLVDGWVVYEGPAEQIVDIINPDDTYYTIFTIDTNGNRSSGAVMFVPGGVERQSNEGGEVQDIPPSIPTPPDFVEEMAQDWTVYIEQDDVVRVINDETGVLFADRPFTVFIPGSQVPRHLKTIVVTLHHPNEPERTFSFLLAYNAERDHYQAILDSLPKGGSYPVTVSWFDFAEKTKGSSTGTLTVKEVALDAAAEEFPWFFAALSLLLIVVVLRIIRKFSLASSV